MPGRQFTSHRAHELAVLAETTAASRCAAICSLGCVPSSLAGLASKDAARKLVGTDALGNQYFEVQKAQRMSRVVFAPGSDEADFSAAEIPTQWRGGLHDKNAGYSSLTTLYLYDTLLAWLRNTRKAPPTPEEIATEERARLIVKQRVTELQQSDQSSKTISAPSTTPPLSHAAVGSAQAYEPSPWQPGKE